MEMSERVAVITGGSKGIGRAVALKFARENARLVLVHYDADEVAVGETAALAAELGAGAEGRRVDVSSRGDVELLFKDVMNRHGRVDVLVNNAGITRDTLLMRMTEQDWDAVLAVNLKSVFNCTRAVIQPMMKQRKGRIVNISSVVGRIGNAGQANYAASKAGILGFTKSVAREAAPRGITVNAVAPGFVATEMTDGLSQKVKDAFMQQIPLGRIGEPDDIAEAVYWLCSDAASYITGQTIHVNGGMFM
ncbi:MAG: 3-oxoacyl-[acyl-carrier-protein] reductase [Deltaproteobacteria bacterium]|nr:3-oxoacyl-[acyl-carrier-protein] reductase [Deltaproteobacteria bacterium]